MCEVEKYIENSANFKLNLSFNIQKNKISNNGGRAWKLLIHVLVKIGCFYRKRPIWGWVIAKEVSNFWPETHAKTELPIKMFMSADEREKS